MQDQDLRQHLNSVVARARQVLQAEAGASAFRGALDHAWTLMFLAPVLFLVLHFSAPVSAWLLLPLIVIAPLVYALSARARATRQAVHQYRALGTVDERLHLKDRLVTAAQFLDQDSRTVFMEAAVADAATFVDEAIRGELERKPEPWHPKRRAVLAATCSALLLAAFSWLDLPAFTENEGTQESQEVAQLEQTPSEAAESRRSGEEETLQLPVVSDKPTPSSSKKSPATRVEQARSSTLPEEMRGSRGKTQQGQGANANQASGSREAKGDSSEQSQLSKSDDKSQPKKKKKPPKKKDEEREARELPKKQKQEESGSTAGKGSASGSSRSPAASTWSSKDQVVSEDEDELEDDEDVDDEFDDAEARGGVQPNLRDRRPPVNRDLSVGFGNQKNPDANGRGGPSEQKKSRGVATLVLGVPIPDHIKGHPNPGKTKVTQERVEPQDEETDQTVASAQEARQRPIGPVAMPDLQPWQQELIRRFFLERRMKEQQKRSAKQ